MFDDIEACKETEKPFWETHESNKCPVNSKVPELPWDPAFSSVFNDFHIYICIYGNMGKSENDVFPKIAI